MKKVIIRLLVVVVILLGLAVVAAGVFLDSAVKKSVETVGPLLTKVDTRLDSVSLSLLSGSGKIKGLVVGNPPGFQTPHAISVGTASVAVAPRSVFADKIIIKSILLDAPEITYEGSLTGGDNLHKILANVNEAVGSGNTSTNASGKPARKFQVDDFRITGAKVKVSLKGMGGIAAPITIPEIHLSNLGQGPEGITAAELTKTVLTVLTAEVAKVAVQAAGDIGKGAVDAASKVGKSATESVEQATKGVTDLFKKKKE